MKTALVRINADIIIIDLHFVTAAYKISQDFFCIFVLQVLIQFAFC